MAIIIGALVIIGLLAIVGAVLLLQGGDRAQTAQSVPPPAAAADASESEPQAMSSNGSLPVPVAPEAVDASESEPQAMSSDGSLPVPVAPEATNTVPTDSPAPQHEADADESIPEYTLPIERDTEQHVVLNGQFHELVDQLRTLHEQSVEIEQRLNALNKMVERIDQREAMNK